VGYLKKHVESFITMAEERGKADKKLAEAAV